MKNKRGQGLSTNAIVLIILAVVVLVVLILGFTVGWSKLAPWISSNNVDDVVNQCEIACFSESQFEYCSAGRKLNFEGEVSGLKSGEVYVCAELEGKGLGLDFCGNIEACGCVGTAADETKDCVLIEDESSCVAEVGCIWHK